MVVRSKIKYTYVRIPVVVCIGFTNLNYTNIFLRGSKKKFEYNG